MNSSIPFFDYFQGCSPDRDLQLCLHDAKINGVVISKETRKMVLSLTCRAMSEEQWNSLRSMLCEEYHLSDIEFQNEELADFSCSEKIIFGKDFKNKPKKIEKLELGTVVVIEAQAFSKECFETRKIGLWSFSFDVTDYSNSIRVHRYCTKTEAKILDDNISTGDWLLIFGKVEAAKGKEELQLSLISVKSIKHQDREDTSLEKRTELHLHTQMSNMDALTNTEKVIQTAIRWGHKAIAITDHGVCQSFPTANKAAKGKIKVIYGIEGYYINDYDDRVVVHGNADCSFEDEFVCFDIETTGLSLDENEITEIGAVILKDGKIIDTFNTFVNPGRHIAPDITELTGITDSMVKNAPKPEEAMKQFVAFCGDRVLSAHNSDFDISFIIRDCSRAKIDFHPTYVDTLILAQNLLPELNKFTLDRVADYLNLPSFNHHRASDDGEMVAFMLIPFFQKMKDELQIQTVQQINPAMEKIRYLHPKNNRRAKHIILLAKNKLGLKHLYQLVSLSNLKYFHRYPLIPKSEIIKHREGLIVGSACEAGEVYRAVADHKQRDEILRLASFYDYLEIMPLCNNLFMVRNGEVKNVNELKGYNRLIVDIADELNKPVCATGDVHFLNPEDEVYRHILLASKKFEDADEKLPIYFKTTEEMLQEFSYLGEKIAYKVVISDPQFISNQVENIELLPSGQLFPPRLENSEQELHDMVWNKCYELYGNPPPKCIKDRLNVELNSILGKYDVVYMSAQKLVSRSLENGYLVGSRGSVGSSLVAYMSGITEVNSLAPHYRCPKCKYVEFDESRQYGCGADMPDKICPQCGEKLIKDGFDIPFETFLGYGGGKVPDIDLNFSGEYQSRAHRHAIEMFGESKVFRAGTIGTLAEKTAVGYVLKYLDERNQTVSSAEMQRLAEGCVGVRRTTGQHPGGLVVVPDDMDIEDFTAVQHPADDSSSDIITTHFEYHCMEDNLLKLDMLGHDDPSMIRMMEDLTGVNARTIPLDDPDTMSIFTSSKVLGFENDEVLGPTGAVAIPEFNTRFVRGMLVETQPKDFNTLVRLSGFSHGTDVWLGNAEELIKNKTATVLETVGCRDDIMLYLISKGLEPKMSFKIMEYVRKGKAAKKGCFEEGWEDAMKEHGVPEWYIQSLLKIGYLFPKAHAVAYVTMAFRIAWFKVHYPLEFYATFFTVRAKAFDAEFCCTDKETIRKKIIEILNNPNATDVEQNLMVTLEVCYEFYLRGFHFENINIYKSEATRFLIDNNGLIPPFVAVHGLGEAAALDTVEKRTGKSFISIEEFSNCCSKLSKTHIEQLKSLGAFEGMANSSQTSLFD